MSKADEDLTDEEWRKLLKPDPTNQEMVDLVKANFCKLGDDRVEIIKELESYDDRNYWMRISGVNHLVKVHNGVESGEACTSIHNKGQDSAIHYQYAVMKTLRENDVTASFPIHLDDKEKSDQPFVQRLPVVSKKHSPRKLIVSVYTWIDGIPMSSFKVLPLECIAEAGKYLGTFKQKLSLMPTDDYPAAKRYHQWDGKNTKDLSSFLYCIKDEGRRELVASVLKAFDEEIIQTGVAGTFRKSVLHGDYNDANIIMDSNFNIAGVIDFGDSVESWTVLDCTVAMAYAMLTPYAKSGSGRSVSAAAAFLRGFHSVFPLSEMERKHLVLLIACRLACSVTLGAYSLQQNPENTYLLLHAQPAWNALEFLMGKDKARVRDSMDDLFVLACQENSFENQRVDDLQIPDMYLFDLVPRLKEKSRRTESQPSQSVITFVTGNKKKLEEVQRILDAKALGFTVTNAKIDLPELQGEPVEIAKKKCEEAAKTVSGAVITEDTSLCFTALHDLPGPYIKWFLDKCGHDGLNKLIAAHNDKTAYAQTVVAYCEGPGEPVVTFEGRTMGKVVPPRGSLDFGWDPVFEPDEGNGKTYAEMAKHEKDSISHRSRAFSKLKAFLAEKNAETA